MKAGKIHKLAASLYKPRGSKCGNKVAAYSPEITVAHFTFVSNLSVETSLVFPQIKYADICSV